MNSYLKELIWNECNRANNYITIPGIYRHFKLNKNGEDMIYAVSNVSAPVSDDDTFQEIFESPDTEFLIFHHTELEEDIAILRHKDKYYHHNSVDEDKLVIYTALYGDRQTYVRPLTMFLSRVDKEKYPNATHKFRLERI